MSAEHHRIDHWNNKHTLIWVIVFLGQWQPQVRRMAWPLIKLLVRFAPALARRFLGWVAELADLMKSLLLGAHVKEQQHNQLTKKIDNEYQECLDALEKYCRCTFGVSCCAPIVVSCITLKFKLLSLLIRPTRMHVINLICTTIFDIQPR